MRIHITQSGVASEKRTHLLHLLHKVLTIAFNCPPEMVGYSKEEWITLYISLPADHALEQRVDRMLAAIHEEFEFDSKPST